MLAFGAGNLQVALVNRRAHLRMTFLALNQAMVHELQDSCLIESNNHVIADKKRGHTAHISSYQFRAGLRVNSYILFHIMNLLLRKKLLRRRTMRSGRGSKHNDIFQVRLPPFYCEYVKNRTAQGRFRKDT